MTNTSPTSICNRLLLTGAAGGLGKVLRERLRGYAQIIRLSDISPMQAAVDDSEEVVPCDLANKEQVHSLVSGVDAIIHFGGISTEHRFEDILEANIRGTFNVYEAARRHGVKRLVFASSNHVIGFYKQNDILDADVPHRPDSYYGLSKAYGEDLASFYFDRYGIETVSIRIGSSFDFAKDRRMLSTWLSYADLTQLIVKSLLAKEVGHTVVYGASNNEKLWWDNKLAAHLNFTPSDSSEGFRASVEALPMPANDDPSMVYQGGAFTRTGPFDD